MSSTEDLAQPFSAVVAPRRSATGLTLLMSAGCAISVANMYYCQPLLAQMGASVPGGQRVAGYLPTFTQVGTMLGMGLFVPLGDMFERRGLIVSVCLALASTAALTAVSPNALWLATASFILGLTSIIPHLILPFVAQLADPAERGKALGTVVSGMLIGILCARTFSGFAGAAFGWRAVYWIGAVAMIILAWMMRRKLPESRPATSLSYPQLLCSLVHLVRHYSELRQAAVTGGMLFGAFSAFWATLIFRLMSPPYHYGSRVAGLFGLVGAAGAAIAPVMGRLVDRRGVRMTVGLWLIVTAVSFLIFLFASKAMLGLVAGVVLMDLGVQAGHVANQARIYAILPEARSRLNTVYMVSYFLGGAVGSALGAYGWNTVGWTGVCAVGLGLMLVALGNHCSGMWPYVRARNRT
jgi:predicted MFS family arabinose efflux permease